MHTSREIYISVDVETAGPHPARYALLSIGACLVDAPEQTFYVELQPVSEEADARALAVSGLSLAELAERGVPPGDALVQFEAWVASHAAEGTRPVFVAFNAPFDWMFVQDYFHRFLGRNPFGHSALDVKAFYMGMTGVTWGETALARVAARYGQAGGLSHNALEDAQAQARLFAAMLAEARGHGGATDTATLADR